MKKENEANAAGSRIKDEEVAKHTIKDSVFTNLFQDKKYLLQLYKTLHPEDTQVSEDALSDITIHNIMTNDVYNDVGFMVGEKLLILTEAQTTWTENIAVRILIYLMVTYQDYIKKTKQNAYRSKKIKLPRPELYVIYTGDRKERTEYISLADEFFEGQKTFLDAKIKVLYGSGQGDIISQYVTFTKVYDEQRKLHGRTRKAVTETIRICKDKNVLKEYLEEREKEVENIMLAMYDEKEILREYIESERYDTEKEMAVQLLKEGLSVEQIARCSSALSVDEVRMLQEELAQSV
ncbi:MAG: hypothetical protein HFG35_12740 [Eubacterium sp.]|jgi:hypothetical protein|nr:hypothetical protein [Eubacterium sp.]